jgi:hypothetical protein
MSDLDRDREVAAALPTLEQARADVSKGQDRKSLDVPRRLQRKFITRFGLLSVEAERSYTHLAGLKAHYIHKAIWSYFLIFLMASMCPASAPMRQIGRVEEGRISGSS